MVEPQRRQEPHDEALSAMADGQALPHEVERVCAAWRDDAQGRGRWHAYHLIGDVLRSEDLASDPGRDEAFLHRLRERLAEQPVVLAPAPAVSRMAHRRWMRWAAPGAVAAGFVAVAGVLVVARQGGPSADAPVLAVRSDPSASAVVRVAAPAPSVTPAALPSTVPAVVQGTPNGPLLRDARLDRYLAAHRGVAIGSTVIGAPGSELQRVDALVAEPGR